MSIHKAVIPAAGLGTRFLPATKATPKEMLPVVDKPAVQYVVEEAVRAGLEDILVITGRNKESLENHFDRAWELEFALEAKDDQMRLERVRQSNDMADVHFLRQGDPKGLGHAVLCARRHIGDEPFAVLLGDDLIDERDPILDAMISVRDKVGGSVIALLEVDPETISMYGAASTEPASAELTREIVRESNGRLGANDVVHVTGLVEKPNPDEAPSNLAVIGRYVLDPAIFSILERLQPGRGDEIQLTDALQALTGLPADQGGGVHGIVFRGRRYDTGDRLAYLKAVVEIASDREDLGPEFREWLIAFASGVADRDYLRRSLAP